MMIELFSISDMESTEQGNKNAACSEGGAPRTGTTSSTDVGKSAASAAAEHGGPKEPRGHTSSQSRGGGDGRKDPAKVLFVQDLIGFRPSKALRTLDSNRNSLNMRLKFFFSVIVSIHFQSLSLKRRDAKTLGRPTSDEIFENRNYILIMISFSIIWNLNLEKKGTNLVSINILIITLSGYLICSFLFQWKKSKTHNDDFSSSGPGDAVVLDEDGSSEEETEPAANEAGYVKTGKKKRKRKNQGGEKAKPKAPKLSFDEMIAKGYTILEVRATDPEQKLDQKDFDAIELKVAELYIMKRKLNKELNLPVFQYKSVKSGISQKGLWYALGNMETAKFLHENIPKAKAPEGNAYGYFAYEPNERPFRYVRAYVPEKFWKVRKDIPEYFKAFNEGLDTVTDEDGVDQDSHVKMTDCKDVVERKIFDKKGKLIKTVRTFMVELEIDHQLITPLVKLKGVIRLANTTVSLIGAGLEALIKADEQQAAQVAVDQDGQGEN